MGRAFLILKIVLAFFMCSFVSAETTFFYNPEDVFILTNSKTQGGDVEITGGGEGHFSYNFSDKKKDNGLGTGNLSRIDKEIEKQNGTKENILQKELIDKKTILYSIIILIIISVVLYLKKIILND